MSNPIDSSGGGIEPATIPSITNTAAPRRRRERTARAPVEIDPAELAKFNLPGATSEAAPEKTSVSGLMAPSPEPTEKHPKLNPKR